MTGWYGTTEPLPVPMLRTRAATLEEAIAITDAAQTPTKNADGEFIYDSQPVCGIEGCDWPLVTCGMSKLPEAPSFGATVDRSIGLGCPASILGELLCREEGW